MKAIIITGTGGPEVLEIGERPIPEPGGSQIRVRVRACGLNRADLLQCRGFYPAPPGAPADIPGLEFAGEIDGVGPDCVSGLKPGDRVFGIVAGGGQAEFVLTHERLAAPIPENLDFVQAAAVPEAFITAHDALLTQGHVAPGERVLVHAAGSGVGTAAVQVARAMGCRVLGTSRTPRKLDRLKPFGLDQGIHVPDPEFVATVRELTASEGVDVIVDLVGAAVLANNLRILASRGRLVLVGLLGGTTAALDLNQMLRSRLTLVGTTLRARPLEEKIAASRKFAAQVIPWLNRGVVQPVVDSVFGFEDFRSAQMRLESNEVFGKVILKL
jgi:putative PIG3 family NAD(P)H quinone oxidoreductase